MDAGRLSRDEVLLPLAELLSVHHDEAEQRPRHGPLALDLLEDEQLQDGGEHLAEHLGLQLQRLLEALAFRLLVEGRLRAGWAGGPLVEVVEDLVQDRARRRDDDGV